MNTAATAAADVVAPPHLRNNFLPDDFKTVTTTPDSVRETLLCGPLLRYSRTDYGAAPRWYGTVLLVVRDRDGDGAGADALRMAVDDDDDAEATAGEVLLRERGRAFVKFDLEVALSDSERSVRYEIRFGDVASLQRRFCVPGVEDTMRIMFHSCNGFSVGSNEEGYSGPALWNDVLRVQAENPFHVMIGGGDQIYSDGIRVSGPLRSWADMKNPIKKLRHPWSDDLEDGVDEWYCQNYIDWYATSPFSHANSQIPQVNIWDDHDIIDGFGSYTDDTMKSPVFRGIGMVAHKYYLLFQHHQPPELPHTPADPSIILSSTPGPYIPVRSMHLLTRLGRDVLFLGVDARTERTRHIINTPETYDLLFSRVAAVLSSPEPPKHLLVLLGVPIAYPRLVWLETIIRSPVVGLLRFLNKRFAIGSPMFNHFDGAVDIQDDLSDHYCARTHKVERNNLLMRFQAMSKDTNTRVTFLSGDVHLAAIGRFYSSPALKVPTERDHRYMVNVISSAITNKPPPLAVSNLLARRNKRHRLGDTEECLLDFFDRDVDGAVRSNRNTMPRRNYCVITPSVDGVASPPLLQPDAGKTDAVSAAVEESRRGLESPTPESESESKSESEPTNGTTAAAVRGGAPTTNGGDSLPPRSNGAAAVNGRKLANGKGRGSVGPKNAVSELERYAGASHPAALAGVERDVGTHPGALNVAIRVEKDRSNYAGECFAYGFAIPALEG